MATSVKDWRRQVEPHFAFLDDYGFRIEDRFASSSFWSTRIVYARDDHGIGVDRSVEFNRAEVALLRLVDGELPTPQVWVTGAAISSILLDNVLRARDPNRFGGLRQLVGLGRQDVDNQLRELAAALREVAEDFLSRRFAAMEAGEQVIRSQLEQSPQELTVWLPDDATQDDEHQALADARATSPPEVSVVVKALQAPADLTCSAPRPRVMVHSLILRKGVCFGAPAERGFRPISARFGPIGHPGGVQGAVGRDALAG